MKLFSYGNRNFGLDIARCIAILLVLLAHSGVYFVCGINVGFLGVEIFFVLSGFLIGQIILKEFKEEVTFESCGSFYINRWLRTFPLYYLVLLTKDMLIDHPFHPKHYLFIQQNSDLVFFPVSWSLAIEEWFYILIPIVFIVNTKWLKFRHLTFIVFLMSLVVMARYAYITNYQPEFDLNVRKSIPLRFDALLTGVLFSVLKANFNRFYIKISNYRAILLSLLLFMVGFFIYRKYVLLEASVEPGFIKNIFQTVVFIFFSFSFGFFIIWLEQSNINSLSKKNIIIKIVTILSILTYAIYLIHYDIFKILIKSPAYTLHWLEESVLAMGIVVLVAFILHIILEKPVMDYRKSLIKKIFSSDDHIIIRKS